MMTATDLAANLASRLCHDLVNPIGAVSSGLSMREEEGADEEMRAMADGLVAEGTQKALALLSFARLAYGAAGGLGAEIKTEDAEKVVRDLFAVMKADLDWQIPAEIWPKNRIKILLIFAAAAGEAIPRGGLVRIESKGSGGFTLTITGSKMFLNEDFLSALGGDSTDIKPKTTPAYLAHLLASEEEGSLTAEKTDAAITFSAAFSGVAAVRA